MGTAHAPGIANKEYCYAKNRYPGKHLKEEGQTDR